MRLVITAFVCLISMNVFGQRSEFIQEFTDEHGKNVIHIKELITPGKQSELLEFFNKKARQYVNSQDARIQQGCKGYYRIFSDDFNFTENDFEHLYYSPEYKEVQLDFNQGGGLGGGWECSVGLFMGGVDILHFFDPSILSRHYVGCMDSSATNYHPMASKDNGSCEYPSFFADLNGDDILDEISLITNTRKIKTLLVKLNSNSDLFTIQKDIKIQLYSDSLGSGGNNFTSESKFTDQRGAYFSCIDLPWLNSKMSLVQNPNGEVFLVSYASSGARNMDWNFPSSMGQAQAILSYASIYLYKLTCEENKLFISEYADAEYFRNTERGRDCHSEDGFYKIYDLQKGGCHQKVFWERFEEDYLDKGERVVDFGNCLNKKIEITEDFDFTQGLQLKCEYCGIKDFTSEFINYDRSEFNKAFDSLLSEINKNIQSHAGLADSLLNVVYNDLLSSILCFQNTKSLDQERFEKLKNELKNAQRAWIKTRDADCSFYLNSTIISVEAHKIAEEERLRSTKERINKLLQLFNHTVFDRML